MKATEKVPKDPKAGCDFDAFFVKKWIDTATMLWLVYGVGCVGCVVVVVVVVVSPYPEFNYSCLLYFASLF